MIIVSLSKPFLVATDFRVYSPFVWRARLSFIGYTQPSRYDSSYDMTTPPLNSSPQELSDVYIDNISYAKKTSIAECQNEEQSFYMDTPNQYIYIHYIHNRRPTSSDFGSQANINYSSSKVFYDSNNLCYEPYVLSSAKITETGDSSKMVFPKQNIKMDNSSGEFDSFYKDAIPGSEVRIKYISDLDVEKGLKGLREVYFGKSVSDKLDTESYSVISNDPRAALTVELPTDYINSSEGLFGNGEVIPVGYGEIDLVTAYPLDQTADPTYKVSEAYYFAGTPILPSGVVMQREIDRSNWENILITSQNPSAGTFKLLSPELYSELPTIRGKISFETWILNPIEIIIDLMERYAGIEYNIKNFDIPQIESEKTRVGDITLYINERKPLFEWIEIIQSRCMPTFKLITKPDGRYSFKVRRTTRPISRIIDSFENISNRRDTERSFTNYASSITVKYDYTPATESYKRYEYDALEDETVDRYRIKKNIEVKTFHRALGDVQFAVLDLAKEYSVIRHTVKLELDELSNIEIYDVIQVNNSFYEGLNIVRDYIGILKLMVTKITYDFANEKTTIEGLDISDIEATT